MCVYIYIFAYIRLFIIYKHLYIYIYIYIYDVGIKEEKSHAALYLQKCKYQLNFNTINYFIF